MITISLPRSVWKASFTNSANAPGVMGHLFADMCKTKASREENVELKSRPALQMRRQARVNVKNAAKFKATNGA